jgi:hypothetical protein
MTNVSDNLFPFIVQSVIRGLAVGTVNDANVRDYLLEEMKMAVTMASVLGVAGCIRAAVFLVPARETMAITTSLWLIVFFSIVLGSLLPLAMKHVNIDPAHSSTTIQVLMDILGVVSALECKNDPLHMFVSVHNLHSAPFSPIFLALNNRPLQFVSARRRRLDILDCHHSCHFTSRPNESSVLASFRGLQFYFGKCFLHGIAFHGWYIAEVVGDGKKQPLLLTVAREVCIFESAKAILF